MTAFPEGEARRVIAAALAEDVGPGDVTTLATIGEFDDATAELVAKEPLRLAGLNAFKLVFSMLDPANPVDWSENFRDGEDVAAGDVILTMKGRARTLLTGERTALNLLQRLCGIATLTASWVKAIEGQKAKLVDTRKTTPGLRALEKYAVRVGGAGNHRFGLFDGVLIKENHIRAAGSISRAVSLARAEAPHTLKIEVEVTNHEELKQAIEAGADIAMLDNMSDAQMAEEAVFAARRITLEASGNMTLARLPFVAATGVDLISSGSLTHSARAVDLSLLFVRQ